jgi:hypothetical protein
MFNVAPTLYVFAVLLKGGSGPGFLIGVGIVVALLLLSIPMGRRAKKRAQARTAHLKQIARQMGWTFRDSAPLSLIPTLDRFAICSQRGATSKRILNLMAGKIQDTDASVFEYTYSVQHGSAEGTTTTTAKTQTVAYFKSPQFNLPEFLLRPKRVTQKSVAAVGSKNIAFDSYPTFSQKSWLGGPDEQAIRSVFHHEALTFFENNLNLWVEGHGNELLVYRLNKIKPEELNDFLNQATNVLRAAVNA